MSKLVGVAVLLMSLSMSATAQDQDLPEWDQPRPVIEDCRSSAFDYPKDIAVSNFSVNVYFNAKHCRVEALNKEVNCDFILPMPVIRDNCLYGYDCNCEHAGN